MITVLIPNQYVQSGLERIPVTVALVHISDRQCYWVVFLRLILYILFVGIMVTGMVTIVHIVQTEQWMCY